MELIGRTLASLIRGFLHVSPLTRAFIAVLTLIALWFAPDIASWVGHEILDALSTLFGTLIKAALPVIIIGALIAALNNS